MGEEITTIDISNAEELSASSFTNVKNSINIKIDNSGDLTDANDNAVTMLNFGNRGDHCVTVINAELPSNFSEGYRAYFLVNLKNKTYIQKCLMEGNIAKALITKEISLDSQSTECLFALIEANATTGNLREQQEIFVSDIFMGTVRSNFLDSNWMDADISVSEDLTVLDKFETPNPDKYTSMVWVNGETKLNAANMNNIIKGIDELKEQAVAANPTDDATAMLSKLKVGSTTYGIGSDEIVEANGTFQLAEDETGTIINTISFDNNIAQKIKEGKIKVIYGYLQNCEADNDPDYFYCTLNRIQDAQTNYPTYYYRQTGNDSDADIFTYVIAISFSDEEPYFSAVLGKLKNGSLTPSLPSDASSKTYTFKTVNSVPTWVDTSVGTQNFENINVNGTITASGKKLDDSFAVSMSFTNEEIVSALDDDVTKTYTGDDVAQLDEFVEGQNGKILASLVTPVGTINITLYPCSFGGDVMYSFQGLMNIHTNFESIGGKRYSTLFVSAIKILNDPLEVHTKLSIRLVGIGA